MRLQQMDDVGIVVEDLNAATAFPAAIAGAPHDPPPNTLGLHRAMLAVEEIDDTLARLRPATAFNRPSVHT